MRVLSALLAGATAIGGFAALPSLAAAQDAIVITTDRQTYIDGYGADPFVHITVSGLEACAGETVEVGLYVPPDSPVPAPGGNLKPYAGRTVSVEVAASGSFTADVRIPFEQSGMSAHPAVVGDCVPGGFELGQQVAFLHADPPFGPVLPPEPLPEGVTIDVSRVDDVTVAVNITGFPLCAERAVGVSLATETGGSVFPDPNIGVNASATFDDAGTAFAALKIDRVPPGRYIAWIRSICTGTWVAPGVIDVAGAAVAPTPGPPVAGAGASPSSGGSAWVFVVAGAALLLGSSVAGVSAAARRRS